MNGRRTFLSRHPCAITAAAIATTVKRCRSRDKVSPTSPKVVSGNEGKKVWAMGVLDTVKVTPKIPRSLLGLRGHDSTRSRSSSARTRKKTKTIYVLEGDLGLGSEKAVLHEDGRLCPYASWRPALLQERE